MPSLQPLVGNFLSPYTLKEITARVDYQLSPKNSMYIRYSHDGNFAVGPYGAVARNPPTGLPTGTGPHVLRLALPRRFRQPMVEDQVPALFYHQWDNNAMARTDPVSMAGVTVPHGCVLGVGLPTLTISGLTSTLGAVGINDNGTLGRTGRSGLQRSAIHSRWQRRATASAFWDRRRGDGHHQPEDGTPVPTVASAIYSPTTIQSTPVADTPQNLATYFPNLPTLINSNAAIPVSCRSALRPLPFIRVCRWATRRTPAATRWASARNNWRNSTRQVADTWKVRPNLTLNVGLGYDLETNLYYTDLPYPQYQLALPRFSGKSSVGKTASPDYLNFSPDIGFTWSPFKDNKTVVRGGWRTLLGYENLFTTNFKNGFALGPPGNGRTNLSQSVFTNPFPGIVNFTPISPVASANACRAGLQLTRGGCSDQPDAGPSTEADDTLSPLPVIQAIFPNSPAIKSGAARPVSGIALSRKEPSRSIRRGRPPLRSYQTSIGVQRDLGHNMVLSADWARRLF